jgi:predicted dehydrogenase
VALVGAAHIHMPDLVRVVAERPHVEVVAVVDDDRDVARRWAGELGATVVGDSAAALAIDGVDGIVDFGRPSQHRRSIEAAAARELPVFVEKPLAVGAADVDALATRGDELGGFSIGFFLRYAEAFVALRRALADGRAGEVEHVRTWFVHGGLAEGWFDGEHAWMRDPAEGGGGFFELAVHGLDLVRWVLGGELAVERVALSGAGHHGKATLRTSSGATVELEAGWEAPAMAIGMTASGSAGTWAAHGGQLRYDGDVVLSGRRPEAGDGPAVWLDALAGERRDLVPLAAAVTNARDVLALRRASGG